MLILNNLGYQVGSQKILHGISLEMPTGSLTVVLGPTGAGKTSLLRLLAGLEKPSTGSIEWEDQAGVRKKLQAHDVALVYQQFVNYPSLTVYDNIASPLRQRKGNNHQQIHEKVTELAELLGLQPFLKRLPHQLSGGQQQRTAIARALAKSAKLLLLDEPLVNLDYKLREALRQEFSGLFKKSQATVIYTSTEPEEALAMGGQIAILSQGHLLQTGVTRYLYDHPATIESARIFSSPPMNILPAYWQSGHLTIGTETYPITLPWPGMAEAAYQLGIMADDLQPVSNLIHSVSSNLVLTTTVLSSEINGSETLLHLKYQGFTLVMRQQGVKNYQTSQELHIQVSLKKAFVFDNQGKRLTLS